MGLVLLAGIGVFCLAVVATISFLVMYKIITKKSEYRSNHLKNGSVVNAIRGNVDTFYNGSRDSSIHAGIVVDEKTNTWVEQGALSDGAIDAVLKG